MLKKTEIIPNPLQVLINSMLKKKNDDSKCNMYSNIIITLLIYKYKKT